MATAYLNTLSCVSQSRDKTVLDFMYFARLFVLKALLDIAHAAQ